MLRPISGTSSPHESDEPSSSVERKVREAWNQQERAMKSESVGRDITDRRRIEELGRKYEFIANASREFMTSSTGTTYTRPPMMPTAGLMESHAGKSWAKPWPTSGESGFRELDSPPPGSLFLRLRGALRGSIPVPRWRKTMVRCRLLSLFGRLGESDPCRRGHEGHPRTQEIGAGCQKERTEAQGVRKPPRFHSRDNPRHRLPIGP